MKSEFWHQKWQSNDIGFDQPKVNPIFVQHFSSLNLHPGSRVFVPLCGKSIDMVWLVEQGHHVVGVELSEDAIQRFFAALDVTPRITKIDDFFLYQAEQIDIYVGDFFALRDDHLGEIAAIYDRAALVALPLEMRIDYCQHLVDITHVAPQVLITFEYNQELQAGPPFAISHDEVKQHYADRYQLQLADSVPVAGGLKGGCDADEQLWLLQPPTA